MSSREKPTLSVNVVSSPPPARRLRGWFPRPTGPAVSRLWGSAGGHRLDPRQEHASPGGGL